MRIVGMAGGILMMLAGVAWLAHTITTAGSRSVVTDETSAVDNEHRHVFCVCSECVLLREVELESTNMVAACGVRALLIESMDKPKCPRCTELSESSDPDSVPCAYCGHITNDA